MWGPFRLQPQRLAPTSRTLIMIDGLFDDVEERRECVTSAELNKKSLVIANGRVPTEDDQEECCETESEMTLSERVLSLGEEFEA